MPSSWFTAKVQGHGGKSHSEAGLFWKIWDDAFLSSIDTFFFPPLVHSGRQQNIIG